MRSSEEGAGLIYLGSAAGIPDGDAASAAARIESDQAGAHLGRSVAGAGDVNGDGYDDVVLGGPDYAGASGAGAAFLFHGSAAGIASGGPATAAARIESDQAEGAFGWSVAGAGDRDGDGHDDIVVGAPEYPSTTAAPGAAFVFLGGAAGIGDRGPAGADVRLDSLCAPGENADMAYSVAGAGDVNGDGHDDLVVGHIGYPCDWTSGAAFVYLGGSSVAFATGPQDLSYVGQSVAGAGDVNGDGYGDVIVGAPGYDGGETDEGAAFVFLGSPLALAAQLESDQADAHLGQSVAGAGDVNGDGYDDVVVGAPDYEADGTDGGAAFLFLGGPDGVSSGNPAAADTRIQSDRSLVLLGYSVAGAGDVNGDGYDDVLVGAPDLTGVPPEPTEGAAYVFLGSAAGVLEGDATTATLRFEPGLPAARFGASVPARAGAPARADQRSRPPRRPRALAEPISPAVAQALPSEVAARGGFSALSAHPYAQATRTRAWLTPVQAASRQAYRWWRPPTRARALTPLARLSDLEPDSLHPLERSHQGREFAEARDFQRR